ncbi:MAG TPA: RIP metalloprotease RseP, partial [Flavobacteriales bacterium]|nr:RIP metalloprotease RseP [Flavobacteriales bacterium]
YGIGWLPLGGYVKIAGMIDESMDKEAMALPPEPWEFRSKPAWQRLIVMLGGVAVNVLLGMLIFSMMVFGYGEKYLPVSELKNGIVALELAQEIGLQNGDKIISIGGNKIEKFRDLLSSEAYLGSEVDFEVNRDGQNILVPVPPDFLVRLSKAKARFVDKRQTFYVKSIIPNMGADKGGLIAEDVIKELNGTKFQFFDEFIELTAEHKGETIELNVMRDGQMVNLQVEVDEQGKLGFYYGTNDFEYVTKSYGLGESFVKGSANAWSMLMLNIKGFGKIFSGDISFQDSVAGPIGIAQIYGGVWDWQKFWLITGVLSMILAFMNILPIPALDGGHVIFLTLEALSGKTLSDSFMEKSQVIGMVLLFALMTFVIGNDIWNLIRGYF